MAPEKEDKIIPHPDLNAEQVSGVKIGIWLVSIMAFVIILGLVLSSFCPHTYERLRAVGYGIMGTDINDNQSDDDD